MPNKTVISNFSATEENDTLTYDTRSVSKIFNFFSNLAKSLLIKDTHREKAPSNKTPALRKSTNMGVWAVGTLSQLFIRGS